MEAPRFPDERDAAVLGSRVMRPRRAKLAAARAVVARADDPREAWEALAARDLIPMDWVGASGRAFRGGWKKNSPPTVDAAALLAADAEGVAQAEELLRECARRLRALGHPCDTNAAIRWWFVRPSMNVGALKIDPSWWELGASARAAAGQILGVTGVPGGDRTSDALATAAGAAHGIPRFNVDAPGDARVLAHLVRGATRALWSARGWYVGVRAGVTVRLDHPAVPRSSAVAPTFWERAAEAGWLDRPLGEMPDPFEPLLRLWATGYAPGEVSPTPTLYALE